MCPISELTSILPYKTGSAIALRDLEALHTEARSLLSDTWSITITMSSGGNRQGPACENPMSVLLVLHYEQIQIDIPFLADLRDDFARIRLKWCIPNWFGDRNIGPYSTGLQLVICVYGRSFGDYNALTSIHRLWGSWLVNDCAEGIIGTGNRIW
jgi:hypothetical protein